MTTSAALTAGPVHSNGFASPSPHHYSSHYSKMYSSHGSHHLHASGAGSGYSSSTTSASGHHGSTDSGLAPQSSFDTVPGSQHGSAMHQAPSSGGPWGGQSMHYGGSANGGAYGSAYGGAGGYYGSAGTQTPSGTVGGASGYPGYGVQPHQAQSTGSSGMYAGHNGSASGGLSASSGLNGNAAGSAHHSGSSTPTSQTPYHHSQHPHSVGSAFPSPQGYPSHHQQGGYYSSSASGAVHGSAPSNSVMSSPSYTSAPQYSTQLPLAGRHRVTTTLWEDEGTLCFQVDARGVCVARRHDNNMINGTKLLNVCGMSRGKRDGILKNEKERIVVKVGAMHLKGVWITFQRGKQLAEQNNILDVVYPLFEANIQSFLYHPDNYPRTAAVMAAAQERHAQRSRASLSGNDSPTGYPRASSQTANGASLGSAPPLMRSNTTPNNLAAAGTAGYGHSNGYTSAPNHSPTGHMGAPPPHSMHRP